MNLIKPNRITTLVLNPSYEPHDWATARNVMRLLTKGAVRGFDANGNLAGWEPCPTGGYPLSWRDETTRTSEDQPHIASGGRQLIGFGEPHAWAVPTVILIRPQEKHLHIQCETCSPNSVEGIYKLYDGVCQFCGEHIPLSEASRDHYFPQAHGGPNDLSNLVLSCKTCNGRKADQLPPYLNHAGNEPRIRYPMRLGMRLPHGVEMREEWRQFLYQTKYL